MPIDTTILSNISETDRLIFYRLCNKSKVDTSELKQLGGHGNSNNHNNAAPPPPFPHLTPPPSPPATVAAAKTPTPKSPASVFARAVKQKPSLPPPLPSSSSRSSPSSSSYASHPAPLPHLPSGPPPMPSLRGNPSGSMGMGIGGLGGNNSGSLEIEERHRRHACLLHLAKMREMGTRLTREFTMEDSADDMQFEIDYQENNAKVTGGVKMMKMFLGFGVTGMEMANKKFGPFLNLNGLSANACQNMDRYNGPLEKIYRRYFRNKTQSPVSELLMLIGGSIIMTHFGNVGNPIMKLLLSQFLGGGGGGPAPTSAPPPYAQRGFNPRDIPMPPPPAPAPAQAPSAYSPAAPAPQSATRRSLRPPGQNLSIPRAAPAPAPAPAPASPAPPAPAAPTFTPLPTYAAPAPAPAPALIFPLAGTPMRGMMARGDQEMHMALPTVIEEITGEDDEKHNADAIITHETFERMMREVQAEELD